MKIASLLIAIALWFSVNSRGVSEIAMAVPLEIKNLPEGFEIVRSKANEVSLGLRGHERLIQGIRIQDIRVYLDMSKMKEGWGDYYINKENIKVPPSIEITKIDPSVIKIKVEETIKKDILVKPDIKGSVPKGYRVTVISTEPKVIAVEGPKSVLRKIKSFKTEPIDLANKTETFEEEVNIITDGKNIRTTEDTVKVTITIMRGKK